MIIDRRTHITKRGYEDEAVEIVKKGTAYVPFTVPYRIYLPQVGPFNVVVLELEFKDLAEYDRFWTGWLEKAPQEWWDSWMNATENGGGNEIYQLVFKA